MKLVFKEQLRYRVDIPTEGVDFYEESLRQCSVGLAIKNMKEKAFQMGLAPKQAEIKNNDIEGRLITDIIMDLYGKKG